MYGEISGAVPGEWTQGAELAGKAEALAVLCWLLSQPGPGQPGPVARTPGTVATIGDTARLRPADGRLATDPGA